jgi:hypothetical protein
MSIRYGRHSVDLEILIRSNGGNCLDRTPIGERRLSIVEPFISKLLDHESVYVSNSIGDFGPGDSPAVE